MIIKRKINDLDICVDVNERASLYFDKDFATQIKSGALDEILDEIYNRTERYCPLAVTWEITNICNFHCPFCYINTSDNSKSNIVEFCKVKEDIDILISRGLLICYITGGEALSHPDFIQIYTYLKRNGVLVAVLSNLSLLTDEHIALFKEYKPYKITASIYGICDETFNKVTLNDSISYKIVLNNILKLKAAGINVTCQTPINSLTINDYIEIGLWCESNGLKYTCSNEINPSYQGQSMNLYAVSSEEFEEYRKKVNRVNVIKSEKRPSINLESKYKKHFDCKAGKHTFVISYDYVLRPCFIMYGNNAKLFPISNGISNSLEEMIAYIEYYRTKTVEYCDGCIAISVCSECMYTQGKQENIKQYMQERCVQNMKLYNKLTSSVE